MFQIFIDPSPELFMYLCGEVELGVWVAYQHGTPEERKVLFQEVFFIVGDKVLHLSC
jgi:hypothetical protein